MDLHVGGEDVRSSILFFVRCCLDEMVALGHNKLWTQGQGEITDCKPAVEVLSFQEKNLDLMRNFERFVYLKITDNVVSIYVLAFPDV